MHGRHSLRGLPLPVRQIRCLFKRSRKQGEGMFAARACPWLWRGGGVLVLAPWAGGVSVCLHEVPRASEARREPDA